MNSTKYLDMIVPSVFSPYLGLKTTEKTTLRLGGILSQDANLKTLASGGGNFINLPYFNDLTGDDETAGFDGVALTVNNITTGQDVAVKVFRGKAFGATDLSAMASGADPMGEIANKIADFWSRREQAALMATLDGCFATALNTSHSLNISGGTGAAAVISASSVIDAKQLLGDSADNLTAIAMHSATYSKLQKDNLIQYIPNSEGVVHFPTYLGYRVIVDDAMPVTNGVYDTYLFGTGAVAYTEVPVENGIEKDRNILTGENVLATRRGFIMHIRGIKWNSSTALDITNEKLATGANWAKVYDDKLIRVVRLQHKIA